MANKKNFPVVRAKVEDGVLLTENCDGAAQNILELTPDTVHVWLTPTSNLTARELTEFQSVLTPDELERHGKFVFERDRNLYLAAHAQLRLVLSLYEDRAPATWRLRKTGFGRPEIVESKMGLRFSLSHSQGLVTTAVSLISEIGVDVEEVTRELDYAQMARCAFSPDETAVFESLATSRVPDYFFQIWTLKEAFSKATGLGVSIGFEKFTLDVRSDRIRVRFDEGLHDDPEYWHFESSRPFRGHQFALAVRASEGRAIRSDIKILKF